VLGELSKEKKEPSSLHQSVMDSTQFETFSKYLLDQLKSIQNKLEDLNNQMRITNSLGQRRSGLEIPKVGMVRCVSEQPTEFFVDSQEEPPKEKSYGLSYNLKVVNFSELSNLLYDPVNRSTGMSPLEVVHCPKPRKPLDIFPMSLHARVSKSTNTVARHGHDLHDETCKQIRASHAQYKIEVDLC
jgi:hypothetical protein